MAAVAHNLKKYLKFDRKMAISRVNEAKNLCFDVFCKIWGSLKPCTQLNFLLITSSDLISSSTQNRLY